MITATTNKYARVWRVQKDDKRPTRLQISTSRKDSNDNHVYSNWWVTLSKDTEEKLNKLTDGQTILIHKFSMSFEKYENASGELVLPKAPSIVILDADFANENLRAKPEQQTSQRTAPVATDDDLPF